MKVLIGLETHIRLNTKYKLFCKCLNLEALPNTNICVVCLGYPGTLPLFNPESIDKIIPFLQSLNFDLSNTISFDRKLYIYPDLPKNFQITQVKNPIGSNGYMMLSSNKKLHITRAAIEGNAGKTIHEDKYTYLDFNRADQPLLEITTYHDLENEEEVVEYLLRLRILIRLFGISDLNVENGDFRSDVNISVQEGQIMHPRVELKNMNLLYDIKKAIKFEINRQYQNISKYKSLSLEQETRGWDEVNMQTFFMRNKQIYLFMHENDIPVLQLSVGNFHEKGKYDIFINKLLDLVNISELSKILYKPKIFILLMENIEIFDVFYKTFQIFEKHKIEFPDFLINYKTLIRIKSYIATYNLSILEKNLIQHYNTNDIERILVMEKLISFEELKKIYYDVFAKESNILSNDAKSKNIFIGNLVKYLKGNNRNFNINDIIKLFELIISKI